MYTYLYICRYVYDVVVEVYVGVCAYTLVQLPFLLLYEDLLFARS